MSLRQASKERSTPASTVFRVVLLGLACVWGALVPGVVLAQPAAPHLSPGDYVAEGGSGWMRLTPGKAGTLNFSIETVGDNGHACSLDGVLKNGRAKLDGAEDGKPCTVAMALTPEGITVAGVPWDACMVHCGARATFEAVFFKPAPACEAKTVAATRKRFKQHYDNKAFQQARDLLAPLLQTCARSLNWLETGRMRNDLAVTHHKLGEWDACRQVLKPLEEDARMSDAGIRENFAPLDADLYLPIVRATRTNLKLCR